MAPRPFRPEAALLTALLLSWSGAVYAHGAELLGIYLGVVAMIFISFVIFLGLWRATGFHKLVLFMLFISAFPIGWLIAAVVGDQAFGAWWGGWLFIIAFPNSVWVIGAYFLRPSRTVEGDGPQAARLSQ